MWPRPGPVENNSFRHGRAFHVAGAKPVQPLSKHSFEPVRCRLLLSLRDDMRRREFIAGLGATAIVWPRGALGQTRPAVRRIGILMNVAASDPEGLSRVAAFHQGMERLGWSLGRNLRIEYRWATNASERRNFAEELVALSPDAIRGGRCIRVGAFAASNTHHPHSLSSSHRPGRCGFCVKPKPDRVAIHGLFLVRVYLERQMAGIA